MGFNKCIVPSIDYLHGTIIQNGIQEVIKRYKKYDKEVKNIRDI
jgi:hypothetical protein